MEQSHSGLGEGQGRGFWSSGGWDLLGIPPPYSRGWELGRGRPGTSYIMQLCRNQQTPASVRLPGTIRNYRLGEGDLIDIRAPAEPGKEGESK